MNKKEVLIDFERWLTDKYWLSPRINQVSLTDLYLKSINTEIDKQNEEKKICKFNYTDGGCMYEWVSRCTNVCRNTCKFYEQKKDNDSCGSNGL